MYVSQTVAEYLADCDADFQIVPHRHTTSSEATARAASIPLCSLAKGVMFSSRDQFVLALVPASRHVDPHAIATLLHDEDPELAHENDLTYVFRDCERGAIPATGVAFGLPTVVDDTLLASPDIYFEAGDHEHLIHMRGGEFARIMTGHLHGSLCASS